MTQTILCDIGGTHARFARVRDGAPVDVEKYEAAAFAGFMDALNAYTQSCGIEKTGTLRIATAGYKDQGVWRF
ncbi:MAG: glucokinase, partial [Bdellovibrionales bacterium]